jgi:hypothetical protein
LAGRTARGGQLRGGRAGLGHCSAGLRTGLSPKLQETQNLEQLKQNHSRQRTHRSRRRNFSAIPAFFRGYRIPRNALMRFARKAAELGKCHRVRQKTHNQQPGIAPHREQNPPDQHKADQQVGEDRQKEFHGHQLNLTCALRKLTERKTVEKQLIACDVSTTSFRNEIGRLDIVAQQHNVRPVDAEREIFCALAIFKYTSAKDRPSFPEMLSGTEAQAHHRRFYLCRIP